MSPLPGAVSTPSYCYNCYGGGGVLAIALGSFRESFAIGIPVIIFGITWAPHNFRMWGPLERVHNQTSGVPPPHTHTHTHTPRPHCGLAFIIMMCWYSPCQRGSGSLTTTGVSAIVTIIMPGSLAWLGTPGPLQYGHPLLWLSLGRESLTKLEGNYSLLQFLTLDNRGN